MMQKGEKVVQFGQISGVKAGHTGKLLLSPVESGYSNSWTCYQLRFQSRFTARKKDKYHNNINTRKFGEPKDSVNSGESENSWKSRSKNSQGPKTLNKSQHWESYKTSSTHTGCTHVHTCTHMHVVTGGGHVIALHLCKLGRSTKEFPP